MKGFNRVISISLLVLTGITIGKANAEAKLIDIVVHRSPTCNCCEKWVQHLKQHNFKVEDIVTNDVQAIKDKHGVGKALASCHTALVQGYVVEGHVPADDITKLLKNKPKIVGITVPGMPNGTPGMEMGGKQDAYKVIAFDKDNKQDVFSDYPAK